MHVKFCTVPGMFYGAFWLAISDAEQEGDWRDYYSGQQVHQDMMGAALGGLDGGSRENCGIVT